MPADTQGFQSVSHRGQTVLYAACRSPRTNPQLVTYLIEHRGCNVNQPNGPAGFGSLPQHALVQTLQEVLSGTTAPQPSFVRVLLDVLKVLKSKGANMAMANVYNKSALQEFLGLENQMKACPPVSNLVPEFMQVLSFIPVGPPPQFPPGSPVTATLPPSIPHPQVASPYYDHPPVAHTWGPPTPPPLQSSGVL